MLTLSIPTLKWGKRKARSQICEVFTDDGRITQVELPVQKSCADDVDLGLGFLLDADDQFWDDETKTYDQLIYEKSVLPICLIGTQVQKAETLYKVLDQIYDESQEMAKEHQYDIAKKDVWIVFGHFLKYRAENLAGLASGAPEIQKDHSMAINN